MLSSVLPSPRRSNPHIRLNSDPRDLVLSDSGTDPQPPKRPSRSFVRRARLRRENTSATSLYNHGNGTSAELLLPPTPEQISPNPQYVTDRDAYTQSRIKTQKADGSGPNMKQPTSYGAFLETRATAQEHRKSVQEILRIYNDNGSINTQTVTAKFTILPTAALILFPEDVEHDDWLHNPDEKDKHRLRGAMLSVWGIINLTGLTMIVLGMIMFLIAYPTMTFETRKDPASVITCDSDPNCIKDSLPLLQNVRSGLIDPDTPSNALQRTALDGTVQHLVFSDEFNQEGRTFYSSDDPYFQAANLWYGVTQDLEWYDPDAITTANGTLTIRFDAFQNNGLNYRSGMLQSWNQLCFKGGYIEASISLPGRGDTIGFWPGFWTMGNLGRPGYASTTDGTWPYSYWDKCDHGITKNQSQADGLSHLPGMRLPACTCTGSDHPSPGKSRSAPEIDAIEASGLYLDPPAGAAIGSASQSAQFAPFDTWYQPNYQFAAIYDYSVTSMNSYRGGPYQQAISGVTNVNNDWYDGNAYQSYAFEYIPGESGQITWFVGNDKSWTLDVGAVGPNGNIGQRVIPQEPMAIVANFGMSGSFAALNLTGIASLLPATMRIDYIRIYQNEDSQSVTCDPPGYPTTEYIANHSEAYQDWQKTLWEETSYEWPKNSFVDGCEM